MGLWRKLKSFIVDVKNEGWFEAKMKRTPLGWKFFALEEKFLKKLDLNTMAMEQHGEQKYSILLNKLQEQSERIHQLEAKCRGLLGHADRWSPSADDYEKLENKFHNNQGEREEFYRFLIGNPLKEMTSLCELGCGHGEFLELAKDAGKQCVGVDTNSCAISSCQEKGLDVELSDALEYLRSLEANTFDVVVSFHLIEHVSSEYLLKLFSEIKRVLKPEGYALLETPDISCVDTLTKYYFIDPTHLMPRHPEQYTLMLESTGFKNIETNQVLQSDVEYIEAARNVLIKAAVE